MKKNIYCVLCVFTLSCSSRNYTAYLLEPEIVMNATDQIKSNNLKTALNPPVTGSTMVVKWNDGKTHTEILIPMLTSGQRIIVENNQKTTTKEEEQPKIVPPPPVKDDDELIEQYISKGLKENKNATSVSLMISKSRMQEAIKTKNYYLALEYANIVLLKYPEHVEFLRAKGSIYLLLGEKEKAIDIWEKSEEIESNPQVKKKLQDLQSSNK